MIIPASSLPMVVPYCSLCDQPVANIGMEIPKTLDAVSFAFIGQCCGRTHGRRFTLEEIHRMKVTGEKPYLIVKKGHVQQIKAQARMA